MYLPGMDFGKFHCGGPMYQDVDDPFVSLTYRSNVPMQVPRSADSQSVAYSVQNVSNFANCSNIERQSQTMAFQSTVQQSSNATMLPGSATVSPVLASMSPTSVSSQGINRAANPLKPSFNNPVKVDKGKLILCNLGVDNFNFFQW